MMKGGMRGERQDPPVQEVCEQGLGNTCEDLPKAWFEVFGNSCDPYT